MVTVSLNSAKEVKYIKYVQDLLFSTINLKSRLYQHKESHTMKIILGSSRLLRGFEELGLKRGNKVALQAEVPDWIRENSEFTNRCVKGLLDTDGSAYFHRRLKEKRKTVELNFSNKSLPLIQFFHDFCLRNTIATGGNYQKGGSELFIYNRKGITKFFELTDSEKIKNFHILNKLDEMDLQNPLEL